MVEEHRKAVVKIFPCFDGPRVYRLAHLKAAGRFYGRRIGLGREHRAVPIQPASVRNPAGLGGEIADQLLVSDGQDSILAQLSGPVVQISAITVGL